MDEIIVNRINELQDEKERLKAESIESGFLSNDYRRNSVVAPFKPTHRPFGSNAMYLEDIIRSNVTGQELLILCRTTYRAPKAQIEKYVEIIQRLLDAGIFDVPEINIDSDKPVELPDPFKKEKASIEALTKPVLDGAKIAIITAEQKKD